MCKKTTRHYAVYKGDEFICVGTAKECADYMGVSEKSVRFLSSPTHKKRMEASNGTDYKIAIALEDED
ncbi:hypothetical protein FZC76_06930 [Sutcliffiella horikoshii]|uniref:Uncharacterized protein n=1 Tax=Sutcliffiella horikoshii TaxID=79883 RepID=A0A5D4T3F0_9BACI|nr:hypothetical protein [Sutcliffiella horikoshii]TYS68674.1 hypothetical protein FZC76_06930 [Sutcliffiella horikoshii]